MVIIAAGIPRKPGMSRDDLIATNVKIGGAVSEQVARVAPYAVLNGVYPELAAAQARAGPQFGLLPSWRTQMSSNAMQRCAFAIVRRR